MRSSPHLNYKSFRKANVISPQVKRRMDFGLRAPPRSIAFKKQMRFVAPNTSATTPGFPLGGNTAKKHRLASYEATYAPYDIGVLEVDKIVKGSDIDQRERDLIHLKGWKTRFQVHNTQSVPVTVRWAIISPRQTWDLASSASRAVGFLRGFTSIRGINLGSTNSGVENLKNPINDDNFMVMHSSSIELGPAPSAAGFTGGVQANWAIVERWTSLNKQLRYGAAAVFSETPIYLVFWYDSMVRKDTQIFTDISATGSVAFVTDTIAYFHDRP